VRKTTLARSLTSYNLSGNRPVETVIAADQEQRRSESARVFDTAEVELAVAIMIWRDVGRLV